MPNPGKAYSSVTKTAFFPNTSDGTKVVDLLQQAFDSQQVFTIKARPESHTDEIFWNGVLHKTNIYGGPQQ